MFNLNVRWRQRLNDPVTCPPVKLRDLTIIRQSHVMQAFDDSGRHIWTREIAPGPEEGELAATDDAIITTYTIEITGADGELLCSQTRFDIFDEGGYCLETFTAHGTMQHRGLAVGKETMHAWMNDGGIALRRRRLDRDEELAEVLVPVAQPWDDNITKRGIVLIGFAGRRDGASLWDPRTKAMTSLIDDVDVWAHGVTDHIAVFAVGPHEVDTTLVAIDLATRQELWRREDTTRGIAVCDEGVLVYLGGQDRIPALLDIDTGDILWMASTTHRGFSWEVVGSIAMARGRETVAFDLATGNTVGAARVRGLIAFDDYFVAVEDDELVAYDLPRATEVQPHVIVSPRARRGRLATPTLDQRWGTEVRSA